MHDSPKVTQLVTVELELEACPECHKCSSIEPCRAADGSASCHCRAVEPVELVKERGETLPGVLSGEAQLRCLYGSPICCLRRHPQVHVCVRNSGGDGRPRNSSLLPSVPREPCKTWGVDYDSCRTESNSPSKLHLCTDQEFS